MTALSSRRRRSRNRGSVAAPADPERLTQTVVDCQPDLNRYFRRRGADATIVSDLTQEVNRRFYERMRGDTSDGIRQVRNYLMRTASSVWNDHLRKRKRDQDIGHIEYDDSSHPSTIWAPDRLFAERRALDRLLAAIEDLPDRRRNIFILFHLRATPQKQIAEQFGISLNAVERHVIKATAHISASLGDEE